MSRVGAVLTLGLALLMPGFASAQAGKNHFYFYWPTRTLQCDTINLIWQNATPPIRCWIIPMGGQPYMYSIDSRYYDQHGSGSFPIQLQLNYGTNYVVQMSDAHGVGSGGTAEIQQTGPSAQTQCLNTASQNYTNQEFSFSVSGQAKQCSPGFDLAWDGSRSNAPYNATIVPLDQGFYPFDIPFSDERSFETDWQLNLTAGTRFTVMMNNKNGYGRGGVAGIYQVDTSTKTACVAGQEPTTGSWPVGIATNTLPPSTLSPLPVGTTGGASLPGGAIAGVAVGIVALLAIAGLAALLLLRRRRRRRQGHRGMQDGQELRIKHGDGGGGRRLGSGSTAAGLDLLDRDDGTDGASSRRGLVYDPYADPQPRVEPYPSDLSHPHGGRRGLYPTFSSSASSTASRDESQGMLYRGGGGSSDPFDGTSGPDSPDGTFTSAGYAGFGARAGVAPVGGRSSFGSPTSGAPGGARFYGTGTETGTARSSYDIGRTVSSLSESEAAMLAGEGEYRSGPGFAGPLPWKSTPSPVYCDQPYGAGGSVRQTGHRPYTPAGAGAVGGSSPPPGARGKNSLEAELLAQPVPTRRQGPFQIANPDHPDQIPAELPPSLPLDGHGASRRAGGAADPQPRFRRHQDAGRAEEIVDLPPLYTEVPRDGPRPPG